MRNDAEESKKIAAALRPFIKEIIDQTMVEYGVVRRKKCTVTTVYNAGTGLIEVQEGFSDPILVPVPNSTAVKSATVGQSVRIEWDHEKSNAVAVSMGDGTI